MILQAENLVCGYRKALFGPFDFRLEKPASVQIVGTNGSGKTTLARTLLKLLPALGGKLITGYNKAAYVPQKDSLDGQVPLSLRAMAESGLPAPLLGHRNSLSGKRADAILEECGVTDGRLLFREASGGQKQRALIARALISDPDFLLLDEPFANLDSAGCRLIAGVLNRRTEKGNFTFLMIDHHRGSEYIRYDHTILLENGIVSVS